MKKKVVQDVIPPKKSIRNVTLPDRQVVLDVQPKPKIKKEPIPVAIPIQKKVVQSIQPIIISNEPPKKIESPKYDYEYTEPKKSNKKILYGSIALLVLAGIFGISAFFKSADITITPKQETRALDQMFNAKKDITTGGLGYQVVTITKDVEKQVQATGEQQVTTKAQGKIIIYNNYSTQPQKLLATTRFQTPEGLVFRLPNAITVPGRVTTNGKTVAGSIEATVEADKAGDTYNIALKDFTIPGFKGDPRFDSIYGRSKTEMTGGFSGTQKVVSKDLLAQADSELESSLKDSLSKEISTQIPVNYILYPKSISYKLDPITQAGVSAGDSTTQNATLKKSGTASAIIFDKGALSREILAKISPDATDSNVKISNLDSLDFSYFGPVPMSTDTQLSFNLKGSANIIWVIDENKLKSDLLGLSKTNAKTVIATYGNIKEAWVETHPFWNQTIPNDADKVTLTNTAD